MINETRVRRIGLRVKKPHPLVAAARDKMERGWQRNGVLECWPLGIDVSREAATRALTLTDRLIKALEADGIIVDSEVSLGRHYTTARVDGYTYRLKLVEDFRREKKPEGEEDYWDHDARVCDYRRWRSHSTGRLQLRLTKKDYYHGVIESWQDSKACKLEQSIDAIVSRLHTLAAEQRLCDEHREKVWREEQEQEAARARARSDEEHRRLVEQRQRDKTQQRVLALYEEAASWGRAHQLRSYLAALTKLLGPSPNDDAIAWLSWAEQCAVSADPLPNRLATLQSTSEAASLERDSLSLGPSGCRRSTTISTT